MIFNCINSCDSTTMQVAYTECRVFKAGVARSEISKFNKGNVVQN